ncbi:hypothetical protein [Halomonas urumqiensis]|uniref:DUF4212 domain-containing protein n=1 Tax=Halomonas urumqiensis TaxID=1684789 RepID=A0A2N7UG08_9GAMM|nr:hypothetical protein [Halomonas urumqiensis]PMR79364.1 hypothetical protein C1H70_12330 [Halomonas urumqiensis]PTB02667.1 hypothetical protein C6V82_08460 [Halomonas urumqiensis]GHE21159.1 hypothetical protein GCM10017767_16800 [Halomonas urumqiensis]
MESNKDFHKWSSFAKRQAGLFSSCLVCFLIFWNSVAIGEWAYALFGGELRGYGPPQQRWHRVLAMGFVGMYIVGTVLGVINMWRYRKYPEYYDDE